MERNACFTLQALKHGEILALHDALGARIEAVEGVAWLTQPGDARDWILRPGVRMWIEARGTVLILALQDSRVTVRRPVPASRPSMLHRLWRAAVAA